MRRPPVLTPRFAAAVFAVIALSSSCARCSNGVTDRPPAPPVVFALESEPERLAPTTIQNPQTFRVAWQIYEGLVGLTEDGQVAPRLAESWQTSDQRTWTFRLRPSITFHRSEMFGGNSRAVTADDVAWSYAAFCAPGAYASFVLADVLEGCAEYNAKKATTVSGIRVVDPRTVELKLVRPEPFFLNRISTAWIAVFPKESADSRFAERWGLSTAVGTGPFRLVSRNNAEIVMERNPEYWNASAQSPIERLVFRVIANDQLRLAELQRGSVDIVPLSTTLAASVRAAGGTLSPPYRDAFTLKTFATFNHHVIGFNLARVPDVRLRRAISLGTDRQQLARQIVGGYADVTGGPVPPAMRDYTTDAGKYGRFDRAAAVAELKASGYRGQPLELVVHELANSEPVGVAFQQQMKDIGVNVTLSKMTFASAIGRVIKGDVTMFGMFAEIVFSSPEPLLLNLFSSQKIPVPNFWKLSKPSIDAGLDELRSIADRQGRLARTAAVETEIIGEVPAVFLYSQRHLTLYSRRLANLPVSAHEHYQLEAVSLTR